jgi:uncharacterized membrane protein HdeD (DUF308 family)
LLVRPTPRDAVNIWTAGFAAAALIQGLAPRRFAHNTKWGHNAGWQREIAIWNLGTLTTIAALRRRDADPERALIAGFAVLSTLFGANHLAAGLRSHRNWSNWIGAGANAVGLATGLAALANARSGEASVLD